MENNLDHKFLPDTLAAQSGFPMFAQGTFYQESPVREGMGDTC
jgi:hypothetical protein